MNGPGGSELERQMILGLGTVLTAGVIWMASSVGETATALAAVKVQIEALREQVTELKAGGKGAYPAEEATHEFARVDGRLGDLELRLRQMERSHP